MRIATAESFVISNNTLRYKVLGFMAVLILACALSVGFFTDKAYAQVHIADISKGSVEIYPDVSNVSLLKIKYRTPDNLDKDEVLDIDNGVIISGTSTTNFISVEGRGAIGEGDSPVKITLNDVNIANNNNSFCAFALSDKAWVSLALTEGTANTLQSGRDRAGIEVPFGTTISIGGTGNLNASSNGNGAGIGSGSGGNGGTINISGGTINAQSSESGTGYGAGIGSGSGGNSGTINISGGIVNASSSVNGAGRGAGIGGGGFGATTNSGTINISGGTINASASMSGTGYGAGIGGGEGGNGGDINISGGTINAQSSESGTGYGAGIGGGRDGRGGNITISGGTIVAGGGSSASDIGESRSNMGGITYISGGSVCTLGNGVFPAPTNGASKAVYLNTLTLEGGIANATISAGSIDGTACSSKKADPGSGVYGIKDVVSDENGKLYFYLPETSQASQVSLGDGSYTYSKVYKREANNTNAATLLRAALVAVIDRQPESQTVELNAPASALSVAAHAADAGNLSYQWYKNSSNSTSGASAIQDATLPSYTPPTNTLGTTYYYCIITNTKDEGVDKTTATIETSIVSVAVNKQADPVRPIDSKTTLAAAGDTSHFLLIAAVVFALSTVMLAKIQMRKNNQK